MNDCHSKVTHEYELMRKNIWAIRVIAKRNVCQNKINVINHKLKDQDILFCNKTY